MRNKKLKNWRPYIIRRGTFSFLISHFLFLIFLTSCSVQQKISRSARQVLNDSSLLSAQVGISIYEPGNGKYWYNYNGEKYFVPASNTKIPTCYAAMKYLGDSLVGLRYGEKDGLYTILPSGDPTFLHPDFSKQPVYDFLRSIDKRVIISLRNWKEKSLGSGWAWSDYEEDYMAERSAFPVYGNTVTIRLDKAEADSNNIPHYVFTTTPSWFKKDIPLSGNLHIVYRGSYGTYNPAMIEIARNIGSNEFSVKPSRSVFASGTFPFVTTDPSTLAGLLSDTLHRTITVANANYNQPITHTIHSQPVDSLLKPMMHRSDNFFAEQSLLMVSNEKLGFMNDEAIIDTLLQTDLAGLPQKPRWVDGCGLSRYNLFTPQDFVFILDKMKNEFGMDRIKTILPTGGEGTLKNYYIDDKDHIYAKTGSLSGVLCLSGFLYTKKNKLLVFSVLVNNHHASATDIRRAVEKFIQGIRKSY